MDLTGGGTNHTQQQQVGSEQVFLTEMSSFAMDFSGCEQGSVWHHASVFYQMLLLYFISGWEKPGN